jgi:16S rRNA (guanine966-N2)-methyltransferase
VYGSRRLDYAELAQLVRGTAAALLAHGLGAGERVAVHQGDALAFLRAPGPRYDIAFVDPPFAAGLWDEVLALLPARMSDDAWLYVESPAALAPAPPPGWPLHREGRTREVRYALYRRGTLAASQAAGESLTT